MEALLLFLDVGALIAVFAWSIRNSGADGRTTGLFRFRVRLSGQSRSAPQAPPRLTNSR
jgi:hypothetical protein